MGLGAYFIWSCFPFYFKLLGHYDAVEIITHRIIWTFLVLLAWLVITRQKDGLSQIKANPKLIITTAVSGILIASNWLSYVWAVNHDQILDASLGYFISPLMGIGLSFFVLKERLSLWQGIAVALAACAVMVQVIMIGNLPIISLVLAASFALYGIMQRRTPLSAQWGLFVETAALLPACLFWLTTHDVASSQGAFWLSQDLLLLALAGPVTLIPLLLYNKATKLVGFNALSFMQYITPSAVLCIAVFYYHESFDLRKLVVFGLIWAGLILFMVDMLRTRRRDVQH